jgi:hypothetical protein
MRTIIQRAPRVIAFVVAGGASCWALIGLPIFVVMLFLPSVWKEHWSAELLFICGYTAIVGLYWRAIARSPSKLLAVVVWLLSLTANVWVIVGQHQVYPSHWDPWDIWLSTCWLDIASFLSLLGLICELMSKMPNKSPGPTAVGAGSSAIAAHVTSRRWLSFFR